MSITDLPAEAVTIESYLATVHESPAADREFAAGIAGDVIEIVKAFVAVKGRLSAHFPETVDLGPLFKLARTGPMRASDLADHLCTDPSTVSRQVAVLVKSGLIQRVSDPQDGRASILVPTAAGHARVAHMEQLRGQLFAPLIAGWTESERTEFSRLLRNFCTGLGAHLEAVKSVAPDLVRAEITNNQPGSAPPAHS